MNISSIPNHLIVGHCTYLLRILLIIVQLSYMCGSEN